MDLQLFNNPGAPEFLGELFEKNSDTFADLGDINNVKEIINKFTTKLTDLGYDILINNKQKSEYVPISRLNEVIQQRDNFKSQLQELNKQLEEIRNSSKNNEDLQKQMQELINKNQELMKQMEQAKIESEIIFAAKDAINPKDVLVFINFDKIKIDKDGNVVGIEEELNRLRQEKSYLFQQQAPKKGGVDPNEDKQQKQQINMNALIRRAAGRKF